MGTSRPAASSGAVDVQRDRAGPRTGDGFRLVGARGLVLVAYPWDFQSPHGRGRLVGRISDDRVFGAAGRELQLSIRPQVIEPGRDEVNSLRVLTLHGAAQEGFARLALGESVSVRLYAPPGRGGVRPLLGAMRLQI